MGTLLTNTCWPVHFPSKWLACFGVALFAGTVWGFTHQKPLVVPAKPAVVKSITLDFYGFDLEGNPVDAQDQHQSPMRIKTLYELTRTMGWKESLTFTPDAWELYNVKSEDVVWRSNAEHQKWLDQKEAQLVRLTPSRSKRWHDIFQGYRVSTNRSDKAKFDYPVIFEKRKSAGKNL